MRNISFAWTTPQFLAGTKTVTRRMGWTQLTPGTRLCAVEKSQGLRKGAKVQRLGEIEVVSVRRERLGRMTDDPDYGSAECQKEGGLWSGPDQFVAMFCAGNNCTPDAFITRIEFRRLPTPTGREPAA